MKETTVHCVTHRMQKVKNTKEKMRKKAVRKYKRATAMHYVSACYYTSIRVKSRRRGTIRGGLVHEKESYYDSHHNGDKPKAGMTHFNLRSNPPK